MQSKVRLLGHPIHQMLVAFPLGLLGASVAFDILHHALHASAMAGVAHYLVVGGLLSGLAAAPFGLIDWLSIRRGTRAKAVGALHGGGNAVVLALLTASWLLRRAAPEQPPLLAQALSFAGAALSLVTAWLGGELVDRLGVGAGDGAQPGAPSPLRHHPPTDASAESTPGAAPPPTAPPPPPR